MKLFVAAFVLLASVAFTIADPPEGKMMFIECMKESGVTKEEGKMMHQKMRAGEELDADLKKKAGCSAKCMFEKKGAWKDGAVDAEGLEASMSKHPKFADLPNGKEIVKECAEKKGSDDCDTAFQVSQCVMEKVPFPGPPPSE